MPKKSPETEARLKLAIRDIVGQNPLISVYALQKELLNRKFQTAEGNPIEWHYLAKLVRKLNREKAVAVDTQKINERLSETKERYRLIIERLWRIIDWKPEYIELYHIYPPDNADITRAANTILKMDLAILKAEMDAGIFDRKLGSVDVNVYRGVVLPAETLTQLSQVFQAWGVNLSVPAKRPQTVDAIPADGAEPRASLPAAS